MEAGGDREKMAFPRTKSRLRVRGKTDDDWIKDEDIWAPEPVVSVERAEFLDAVNLIAVENEETSCFTTSRYERRVIQVRFYLVVNHFCLPSPFQRLSDGRVVFCCSLL